MVKSGNPLGERKVGNLTKEEYPWMRLVNLSKYGIYLVNIVKM